ncbi:MAG: response regulator [Candidatus Omnitrophica bacterium]|nr:response regulator [Candidatus Omnitrophota bacterium]
MNKKKILLVDDEKDLLMVVGLTIESWGYEVMKASSGKEALQVLKDKNPDLVILDYLMPEMDGIATLQEIRKFNTKIPVIMFTAHPEGIPLKGTDNLGISAFVPKASAEVILRTSIRMVEQRLYGESGS